MRQEHGNTASLLGALENELAVFDEAGTPDYEVVSDIADYLLTYPDTCHHPKEDLVFAKLKQRDPAAAEAIGDLPAEHRELHALTEKLVEAVRNVLQEVEVPRDTFDHVVRDIIESLRAHMEMEERSFFPAALRALTAEDWAEVDAQVIGGSDPLFGGKTEKRYDRLRRQILEWERANVDRKNNSASD